MKDDLDNLKDVNDENIEEGDIGKSNDENLSDNFLKIDPIKSLDSSNIKIEIKKEPEIPKKQAEDDNKKTKTITKTIEDDIQNEPKKKNNLKIVIIIGIATLILILCLVGGYFAYLKFFKNGRKLSNKIENNSVNTVEISKEETDTLAALEKPIEKPIVEDLQEQEEVKEEPVIEDKNIVEDDHDLIVLETVYDEVINKGNEDYLYNFTPRELAIIRNTLYARRGYKFKKKEYQRYFGEKSWYVPTTNSQNILTRNEEKLANIIKRYE